jgi:hypothetical protein
MAMKACCQLYQTSLRVQLDGETCPWPSDHTCTGSAPVLATLDRSEDASAR